MENLGTTHENLGGPGTQGTPGANMQNPESTLAICNFIPWPDTGASLLSFVSTLLTKDHHRKDGKWFEGKEPIDFGDKNGGNG